jgi:hypothetical protein
MAPRTRTTTEEIDDPISETIKQDTQNIADELGAILDSVQGIDQGEIKGILFKIPRGGGKFEWINDVYPPFNLSEIMEDLKGKYGGGDYRLSLMVKGKLRKNLQFSIAADPTRSNPLIADTRKNDDLFAMMMQMQQASSDRMMQMMMAQNASQQQASQNSMQMIATMMGAIIPAIAGGREKTSELLSSFAAINGGKSEGGFMEMLTAMKTAKDLFTPAEPGLNLGDGEDGIIQQGLKLAGSILPAITSRLPQPNAQAPQFQPGPITAALPPPMPPQVIGGAPIIETPPAPQVGTGRWPLLDLIREDVVFLFKRGHPPETAAELCLDVIEQAQVPQEEIFGLVAAFQVSPSWIDELASEGIDLRSNPEWANVFLTELVRLYTEDDGAGDDTSGGAGGETDHVDHGQPVASGIAQFASAGASKEPS